MRNSLFSRSCQCWLITLLVTAALMVTSPVSVRAQNAQLQLGNFVLPSTARPGEVLSASFDISNAGNGDMSLAGFSTALRVLSQSGGFTSFSGSLQNGSALSGTLASGATTTARFELRVPFTASASSSRVFQASASGTDSTTFGFLSLAVETGPLTVQGPVVDLQPQAVLPAVTTTSAGSALPGTFTVQYVTPNDGTFQSLASVRNRFFLSLDSTLDGADRQVGPNLFASDVFVSLDPGETVGVEFGRFNSPRGFPIPYGTPAGQYFLLLQTDSFDSTPEANEANNTGSSAGKITITAGDVDLSFASLELRNSTTSVSVIESIPVSWAVRFGAPQGSFTNPEESVEFFVAPPAADGFVDSARLSLGTRSLFFSSPVVNGSIANNSFDTFSIPLEVPPGDYVLVAKIDPDGNLPEGNKANNVGTAAPLKILPSPINTSFDSLTPLSPTTAVGSVLPLTYVARLSRTDGVQSRQSFATEFRFSTDSTFDSSVDLFIDSEFRFFSPNSPDGSARGQFFFIPFDTATGPHFIVGRTDASGSLRESNENDNDISSAVTITGSVIDLTLTSVTAEPRTTSVLDSVVLSYVARYDAPSTSFLGVTGDVDFFLSPTAQFDPATALSVGSDSFFSLSPQGEDSDSRTSFSFSNIAPGTYTLFAKLDPDGTVPEKDTSNNIVSGGTVTVTPSPFDLAFSSVQGLRTSTAAGAVVPLTYTVSLSTTDPARAQQDVFFDLEIKLSRDMDFDTFHGGDRTLVSRFSQSLKPGESLGVPLGFLSFTQEPGDYFVLGRISSSTRQARLDNDVFAQPLTVTPSPLDLRVTAVSPLNSPLSVVDPLGISVTVKYAPGDAGLQALSPNVEFLLSTSPECDLATAQSLGTRSVTRPLLPGQGAAFTFENEAALAIPDSVAPGEYHLFARVDPFSSLPEVDEANNLFGGALVRLTPSPFDWRFESLVPLRNTTSAGARFPLTYQARLDSFDTSRTASRTAQFEFSLVRDTGSGSPSTLFLGSDALTVTPGASGGRSLSSGDLGRLPLTLEPGTYRLVGRADTSGQLREIDEQNNTFQGGTIVIDPNPIDLSLRQVTASVASVSVDQSFTVSTVARYEAPDGSFEGLSPSVDYYLSKDGVFDPREDFFLTSDSIFSLQPNSEVGASRTVFALPEDVMPRQYTLFGRIDPFNSIFESIETNNVTTGPTVTVTTSPVDVRILSFEVLTPTTSAGSELLVSYTTQLDVSDPAVTQPRSYTVAVFLSLDGEADPADPNLSVLDSSFENSVAPGSLRTRQARFRIPADQPPGVYSVFARADAGEAVREGNEDNNVSAVRSLVVEAPRVDLSLADLVPSTRTVSVLGSLSVSWTASYEAPSDAFASAEQTVEFFLSPSSAFDARTALSVRSLFRPLSANSRFTASNESLFISKVAPGAYHLFGVVDAEDVLPEKDELNNIRAGGPVLITPSPLDVVMESLTLLRTTTAAGATLPVSFVAGLAPSGAPEPFSSDDFQDPQRTVTVTFYASSDRARGPDDVFLKSTTLSLRPGERGGSPQGLMFSRSFVRQQVFILAEATVSERESDASNNVRDAGPVTVSSSPVSLQIESLEVGPADLSVAESLSTTVTVSFTAPFSFGSASASLRLALSPDPADSEANDVTLTSNEFLSFSVGGDRRTSRFTSDLRNLGLRPGTYFLVARLDGSGSFPRAAREDVVKTRILTQTPIRIRPSGVDLRPLSAEALVTTTSVHSVIPATFTALYEVPPQGVFSKVQFETEFFLSMDDTLESKDIFLGTRTISQASPGKVCSPGSVTALRVPGSVAPGAYRLLIKVDSDDDVLEVNEDNNVRVAPQTITIEPSPVDISVGSLSVLVAETSAGGVLPVTYSIDYDLERGTTTNTVDISGDFPEVSAFVEFQLTQRAPPRFESFQTNLGRFSHTLQPGQVLEDAVSLPLSSGEFPPGSYTLLARVSTSSPIPLVERELGNNELALPQSTRLLAPPGGLLPTCASSPHPYPNHYDESFVIGVPGQSRIEVLFDQQTETESCCDRIEVFDAAGNIVTSGSGTSLAGARVTVTGDRARIRLRSDDAITRFGFSACVVSPTRANLEVLDVTPLRSAVALAGPLPLEYSLQLTDPDGDFGALQSVRVDFWASLDTTLDPSVDTLLFSDTTNGKVRRGMVREETLDSPLVKTLPAPGSYHILARVQSSLLNEQDETDNVKASVSKVQFTFRPDDHADSPVLAQAPRDVLRLDGKPLEAELGHSGDRDVFILNAQAGTALSIRIDKPLSAFSRTTRLALLDQDGERLLLPEASVSSGGTDAFRHVAIKTSGTYYLLVQDASTSSDSVPRRYRVSAQAATPDLVALSLEAPGRIGTNETLQLQLGGVLDAPAETPSLFARFNLYSSRDRILNPGEDTLLGSTGSMFAPGSPVKLQSFPLSLPETGTFHFIGVLEGRQTSSSGEGSIGETNLRNNIVVSEPVLVTGPPAQATAAVPSGDFVLESLQVLEPGTLSAKSLVLTTFSFRADFPDGSNIDPSAQVQFFLTRDGDPFASDTILLSASPFLTRVPFRQSVGETVELRLPGDLRPGAYELVALLQPSLTVPGDGQDNNRRAVPLAVAEPQTDLVARDVTPQLVIRENSLETSLLATAAAPLHAKVKVDMSLDYTAPTTRFASCSGDIRVFLSEDTVLDRKKDREVAATSFSAWPQERVTATATFHIPGEVVPRAYSLIAAIDVNSLIREDKTNNILVRPFTVQPSRLDIVNRSFSFGQEAVAAGGTVPMTAVFEYVAPGNLVYPTAQGTSRVFASVDGILDRGRDFILDSDSGSLEPGELDDDNEDEISIPGDLPPGTYSLFLAGDVEALRETSKDNNTLQGAGSLTVVPATEKPVDLQVLDVRTERTRFSLGETSLPVTLSVRGDSSQADVSSFSADLEIFLSQDETLDRGQDRLVHTETLSLSTGVDQSFSLDVALPAGLVSGDYRLIATLSARSGFADTNGLNNTRVSGSTFRLTASPIDLVLRDVSPRKLSFSQGETVAVSMTASYEAPALGYGRRSVSASVFLSPDKDFDARLDRRVGGAFFDLVVMERESTLISFTVDEDVPAGRYWLFGVLDPGETIAEANRQNNVRMFPTRITVEPVQRDLVLGPVSFTPSTIVAGTGSSVRVTGTVSYSVPAASMLEPAEVTLEVFLEDGPGLTKRSFPRSQRFLTLQPGASDVPFELTFSLGRASAGGIHKVVVTVDRTNEVSESDESNNLRVAEGDLDVSASPALDARIVALSSSGQVVAGGDSFSASVQAAVSVMPFSEGVGPQFVPIQYWLSKDRTLETTRDLLLTFSSVSVSPGTTRSTSTHFGLSRSVVPGTYFVLGQTLLTADSNLTNDICVSELPVEVLPPATNRAPVAHAGADRRAAQGHRVELIGRGSDQDFDGLTYTWTQSSGPEDLILTPVGIGGVEFTPSSTGVFTLQLEVTDSQGASDTDSVDVTVQPFDEVKPILETVFGRGSYGASEATEGVARGKDGGDTGGEARGQQGTDLASPSDQSGSTFDFPKDVAADGLGNLYVVFSDNGSSTVISPERSVSGSVVSNSGGSSSASSGGSHRVIRIRPDGTREIIVNEAGIPGSEGDGGPPRDARLCNPHGVFVDRFGGLLIADTGNHRIRRVDFGLGKISTIAGKEPSPLLQDGGFAGDGLAATQAVLRGPNDVVEDSQGNIYIADTGNHRIRKITNSTKRISTIAGTGFAGFSGDGGPATQASLWFPNRLALDRSGGLLISDSRNNRIRRVDLETGIITTVAGTGALGFAGDGLLATASSLDSPGGVAADGSGNGFVSDSGSHRIRRRVTANGVLVTAAGTGVPGAAGDGGPAREAQLDRPAGSTVDKDGNLVFVDSGNGRVRRIRGTLGSVDQVTPTSQPPVARIVVEKGVDGGGRQRIVLNGGLSSDPDSNKTLSYSWTILPPGGDTSVTTATARVFFDASEAGLYTFILTVTDADGLSDTAERRLSIANLPPIADAGRGRAILLQRPAATDPRFGSIASLFAVTRTIVLNGRRSRDPDGDELEYFWEITAPAERREQSGEIQDATSSVARFELSTSTTGTGSSERLGAAGFYQFQLTVTDSQGSSSLASVSFRVIDPNSILPNADAGRDQVLAVIIDPDDPPNLLPTVPDSRTPGVRNPFIRITGHESSDPNDPPLPLVFSWSVLERPEGSEVDLGSQASQVSPTFVPDVSGLYVFRLVVSNGRFESRPDRVRVFVDIRDPRRLIRRNRTPTAVVVVRELDDEGNSVRQSSPANPILQFGLQDTVALDGSFSRDFEDAVNIGYLWEQTAGERVTLAPSDRAPITSFTVTEPGRYEFALRVADRQGEISPPAPARFVVTEPGNALPVLTLTASDGTNTGGGVPDDITATVNSLRTETGRTVTITATVTDANVSAGTQGLSFVYTQLSGPTVLLTTSTVDVTQGLVSTTQFVPTTSRVHEFEVRVSELDSSGNATGVEVARTIRVIVDAQGGNSVPTALIPNSAKFSSPLTQCANVQLSGAGRDEDAGQTETLTYQWVQVSGPQVVLSDPFAATPTFVAPDLGDDDERQYVFQLFVDDGADRSEPVALPITVDPQLPTDRSLSLRRGLNVVALPSTLPTSSTPRASDLADLAGSNVVLGITKGSDGRGRFRVFHRIPGQSSFFGEDFALAGNQSYIVSHRSTESSTTTTKFRGSSWTGEQLFRGLDPGLNLMAYPRGVPEDETASTLVDRTGATYVAEFDLDATKFEVFLPGLSQDDFDIELGKGYLLSMPESKTLTLPTACPTEE